MNFFGKEMIRKRITSKCSLNWVAQF